MYGYGFGTVNRLVFGGGLYTARTSAFATASGISDPTILNALSTLDQGLIDNSLDSKILALYPMVGGTASSHKWNFMDARDLDAAFRLTFSGGWVHSITGALPNGTNAFANTYLIPSVLSQDSNHLLYYSRTNSQSIGQDMGALVEPGFVRFDMLLRWTDNNSYNSLMTIFQVGVASTDSTGFWLSSRTNSSDIAHFRNATKIATTSGASSSPALFTIPIYLGAGNRAVPKYTNRETAMCTVGDGISDSDASTFYTLVQAFQTSLSRQV